MTIQLTEEMTQAFSETRLAGLAARSHDAAGATRAGLRAVLAIVERDNRVPAQVVRAAYERGQRDERALTELLGAPVTRQDNGTIMVKNDGSAPE